MDVLRELVKYLADNQGLAPSESAPYRYLMEQDLNRQEDFDPELLVRLRREISRIYGMATWVQPLLGSLDFAFEGILIRHEIAIAVPCNRLAADIQAFLLNLVRRDGP